MSEAMTRGIRVEVRPNYLENQSDPRSGLWMFAYHVRILNDSTDTVQLLSRHWIITDARGHVEQVRGPGVIGEQPTILPGESYAYASGCPLGTASGSMAGGYSMTDATGRTFEAAIPAFSLDVPGEPRVLN
jgi:ApaG protein